jgi:hypothetical protein
MVSQARLDCARVYCRLASLVRVESVVLADRLIESAARVLAGLSPSWDESVELQRGYIGDI